MVEVYAASIKRSVERHDGSLGEQLARWQEDPTDKIRCTELNQLMENLSFRGYKLQLVIDESVVGPEVEEVAISMEEAGEFSRVTEAGLEFVFKPRRPSKNNLSFRAIPHRGGFFKAVTDREGDIGLFRAKEVLFLTISS